MKSDRVKATTWLSLLGLFRKGLKYLICLVPCTLSCARPASSTSLSVASNLNGTNVTWTYSLLGNIEPDGAYVIGIAGLVVVLVC